MEIETVTFPTPSGRDMRGWLCAPAEGAGGGAPRPAVLVIHEMFGLVENIKPVLRRFAENGYLAMAPDLFDKPGARPLCVARTFYALARGEGDALEDLESAKAFLNAHPAAIPGRLGVVGFCMGGGFALLLALTPGVKASAPFYGMSPVYLSRVEKSCPVIASYGGRDATLRRAWPRLERALQEAGIPHEVKVYPDAGHSYFTETQPGLLYRFAGLTPLKVGFRPHEAEDSWKRMLSFFAAHV